MEYDFNVGRMTLQNYIQDLANPIQVVQVGKDKDCLDIIPDASAAFLGPNLWDESKVDYIDLDSFLNPYHIEKQKLSCEVKEKTQISSNVRLPGSLERPINGALLNNTAMCSPGSLSSENSPLNTTSLIDLSDSDESSQVTIECQFSQSDLALATPPGHKHYDPASTAFPDDELKPQPIIKKSRKNFVPDSLKDDKYWARRHKNNIAAKRSREARRVKENQIVLRASYLEKENSTLKEDVLRLKAENDMLKSRLRKYQT